MSHVLIATHSYDIGRLWWVAILLAIALPPAVAWLRSRGWRFTIGAGLAVVSVACVLLAWLVPVFGWLCLYWQDPNGSLVGYRWDVPLLVAVFSTLATMVTFRHLDDTASDKANDAAGSSKLSMEERTERYLGVRFSTKSFIGTGVMLIAIPVVDGFALYAIQTHDGFSLRLDLLTTYTHFFPLVIVTATTMLCFARCTNFFGCIAIALVGGLVTAFNFWLFALLSGPLV
jgi:hypothetical protein